MENKIYIFGHKRPDTDSVCSSIALSYLKNELGNNTEPRILSNINDETKYVLEKFGFKEPEILNDVKLKVSDVFYHKNFSISINESIYKAFTTMQDNNMSTIPVIDDNNKFVGAFAMKDIAKNQILGDNKILKTNFNHILETIDGTEILKFNHEIEGNLINVAIRSSNEIMQNIFEKNSILIIGDRHLIIENAIRKKIKLIIVTSNNKLTNELLELAKINKVNIIYTKNDSFNTLVKIKFANYIGSYMFQKNLVCVNENMDVTDLNDLINNTKHSYYPVINNKNESLGLIKLADLRETKPKKVLLVDHNEASQSADGLEEAEIIGIVDHHKLGTLGTNKPINFRNMTVGSTCTIIYELFKENKIKIPKNIAGLLLAGITSDTLFLKSPTTTELDKKVLEKLISLAEIDGEKFAMEMFKSGDTIKSKSIKEIVYNDFKIFNIDKKIVGVTQITTLNSKFILKQKSNYIKFLDNECKENNYDIFLLCVTDIFKNGSYVIYNSSSKNIIKQSYGENVEQGTFLEGIVSRKKQVIPPIMKYLS